MNPYKENMFVWKLYVGGLDRTVTVGKFITSLIVKYEINKPTLATIDITSMSMFESMFVEGVKIEIWMGEFIHELYKMFTGTVTKRPDGHAADILTYKVQAIEGKSGTLEAKTKNFDTTYKSAIINEVILGMKFIPVVDIADVSPLQAAFSAIQNNKTNLEFLNECSKKWACTWWIDESINTVYFVDNASLKDWSVSDYALVYKSDSKLCNVESVSWKLGVPAGIVVTGSETITVQNTQIDIDVFNAYGHDWMLSKSVRDSITTDKIIQISTAIHNAQTSAEQEAAIRKFYVTNDHVDKSQMPINQQANGVTMDIDLNWPDFKLRPPRQATLEYGSINPNMPSSNLPMYLFGKQDTKTTFYTQMVETGIRSGVATTKLQVTR